MTSERTAASAEPASLRTAGWLSLGAGATFVLTVGYLFTVLPATGWTIEMFDDPAELLIWIDGNVRAYQGLWFLYFLSQALLLAVPVLLATTSARAAAVVGTASVVLAMAGLAVVFAVSPVLAAAYREAGVSGSAASAAGVLVVHDVTADIGKVLRLFSELLLGVWLVVVGHQLRRRLGRRWWWALSALGGWTITVAGIKLFEPTVGLEDWLGFLLGVGYLMLGVGLLRSRAARPRSRRPVEPVSAA